MEKTIIVKDYEKKVRRFKYTARNLEFRLKPVPEGAEPIRWIREGITEVIEKTVENVDPADQLGITFGSKAIGVGWMSFRPAKEVTFDDVWDIITRIYQSNTEGLNTETFCLTVTTVKIPDKKTFCK